MAFMAQVGAGNLELKLGVLSANTLAGVSVSTGELFSHRCADSPGPDDRSSAFSVQRRP